MFSSFLCAHYVVYVLGSENGGHGKIQQFRGVERKWKRK